MACFSCLPVHAGRYADITQPEGYGKKLSLKAFHDEVAINPINIYSQTNESKTNHTYYLCPKKNGIADITPNPENTLHIKNMVCNRCIMVVKSQLEQLGLHPLSVELGIAVLPDAISDETYQRVKASLETFGFELIDDKKSQTVELIKDAIIELVHYDDNGLKTNLSDYLASKLHRDYSALSKLFSETTNTTIEKYLIATEDRACQKNC